MERVVSNVVAGLWMIWLVFWWWGSRHTKDTVRREAAGSRLAYLVPLMLAGLLLSIVRIPFTDVSLRLYESSPAASLIELVAVALGLGFSVWARLHLGTNWSGIVTVKRDHELIRSGPYAITRHPIYSGILLAFAGMAVGQGSVSGGLAVVLVAIALVRKLRTEERFMLDQFGQAYEQYRRDVPALMPGLRI